jgi:hypothetical protein
MPNEKREFSIGVLLSLTTDKLLCDSFSEVHEAAEFVMGHPIWTHEFADRAVWNRLKRLVLEQIPVLESFDSREVVDEESAKEFLNRAIEIIGIKSFSVIKGSTVRDRSPLETLQEIARGKPVIAVIIDKGDLDVESIER